MREPPATPEVLAQLDAMLRGMNRIRDRREAAEAAWSAKAAGELGRELIAVLSSPADLARECRDGYPWRLRAIAHRAGHHALRTLALRPDFLRGTPLQGSEARLE